MPYSLDLGGYSSRPGADVVSEDDEFSRLGTCLKVVKRRDA